MTSRLINYEKKNHSQINSNTLNINQFNQTSSTLINDIIIDHSSQEVIFTPPHKPLKSNGGLNLLNNSSTDIDDVSEFSTGHSNIAMKISTLNQPTPTLRNKNPNQDISNIRYKNSEIGSAHINIHSSEMRDRNRGGTSYSGVQGIFGPKLDKRYIGDIPAKNPPSSISHQIYSDVDHAASSKIRPIKGKKHLEEGQTSGVKSILKFGSFRTAPNTKRALMVNIKDKKLVSFDSSVDIRQYTVESSVASDSMEREGEIWGKTIQQSSRI